MSAKPDYWESVSSDDETFSEFGDEEEQAQNQQWLVEMAKRGLQDDDDDEESEETKAGMHIEIIKVTKEPTPREKSSFKKPHHTFGELAEMALLERDPSSLQEIYRWIENRYPWYKWCALPKWRVSLRASLCNGAKFKSIVPSAEAKQAAKFGSRSPTIVNFWTLRKGKSRKVLTGVCGKRLGKRTDGDVAKRRALKQKLKERKKEQNERIEQITNPTSGQQTTVKKVVPKLAGLGSARKSFEKLLKKSRKPRRKVPKPLQLSDSELCLLDAELVRTLSTESDQRLDSVEDVGEASAGCAGETADELGGSEDYLDVGDGRFNASGMANFVRTDIIENRDVVNSDHVLQTFCNGLELLNQLEQNSNVTQNEDFDTSSNFGDGFLPDIIDMENPGSEISTPTLTSDGQLEYLAGSLKSSSTPFKTSADTEADTCCMDTSLVTMDTSLVAMDTSLLAMDTSLVAMDTSLGTMDTTPSDPVAMDTAHISLNTPVSMETVYSSPAVLGAVAKDNFRSLSPAERPKDSMSATKLIESLYASIAAVENETRIAASSSLLDCIKTKDGLLSSTMASRSLESLDAPSFTNLMSDVVDFPELGLEMSADLLSGLFDL